MNIYRHLVVGTDFSAPALEAVRVAARWARREGARVTLAHVAHPGYAGLDVPAPAPLELARAQLEAATRELQLLREAELTGVSCDLAPIAHPSAAQALCELCETREADLCVVGTHGRTGLKRLLLGSVAEPVVRHAPCDVLAVRPAPASLARPFFVAATDLSADADVAVDRAAELAASADASVSLVYVYDSHIPVLAEEGRVIVPAVRVKERRAQALSEIRYERFGAGAAVESTVLESHDVPEAIARFAADHHAQLVVVGTRGRTGIARFLIGSVAEAIVRLAPCPVLVIRPVAGVTTQA